MKIEMNAFIVGYISQAHASLSVLISFHREPKSKIPFLDHHLKLNIGH